MDWTYSAMLIPVLVTLVAALILTPVVRAVTRRLGVLAHPDSVRRFHRRPVPLWGGVAVYASLAAGLLCALVLQPGRTAEFTAFVRALLPAAGMACLFGAIDDYRDLSPRLKLLLQLLIVAPIVAAGYYVDDIVVFRCRIELGVLGIPLTIFWLLGCINALNLIDGMDGLASSRGPVHGVHDGHRAP